MSVHFPPFITHVVSSFCSSRPHWLVAFVLQKLGRMLRDHFFLPLYNQALPFALSAERIATEQLERLPYDTTIQACQVKLTGGKQQTFNLRVLETSLGEKKVRFVLFSFYGHTEMQNDQEKPWDPKTMGELSAAPLNVLRALREYKIRVDSLMTVSLGNVVLDGLKQCDPDEEILPPTMIIRNGLASVQKTGNQLFPFPLNYLLYYLAKLTAWNANPEEELCRFIQKAPQKPRIFILETPYDFYFSEKGAFAPTFHEELRKAGASVFRGSFVPTPLLHPRAHHAASLDALAWNCETKVSINDLFSKPSPPESVASTLAREAFLQGDDQVHTCFLVCGNGATLNTGTVLEALPLLSACQQQPVSLEWVS